MSADNVNSFDHTNRLGFARMPPGYLLIQLDSGHFIWEIESDPDLEPPIHWDKWTMRRWAWAHYNEKRGAGNE